MPSSWTISGPSKSQRSGAGSRKREAAKALTPATATKEVQRRNQALQELLRSARGAPLEQPRASASKKSHASADHRPPTPIAVTTNWHLALSRSSGYLRSLRRLASASTFPLVRKARGLGYPLRRSGLTSVVSTATCLPRFACKPFTTHSNRLLSEGQACPRFKKPLCRCPPASLHTRLHILSKGTARACSTNIYYIY